MTITRVEKKRSRQPKYLIGFDDGTSLVLSEDIFVRFAPARGDTISDQRRSEMQAAEEEFGARRGAVHYLSYRPRSAQEIVRYLTRKGFSKARSTRTVAELARLGMVDDIAFAEMFVRDALRKGTSGPQLLKSKLSQKGIDREIIQEVIDRSYPEPARLQQAVALLRNRVRRTRQSLLRLDPEKRTRRLYTYLAQRGFSQEITRKALREIEV